MKTYKIAVAGTCYVESSIVVSSFKAGVLTKASHRTIFTA